MEILGLSKSYNDIPAVNQFEANLERPCVYGLLGANGAGKSTLIKCIMGLVNPSQGEVVLNDDEKFKTFLPEQPYLPTDISALQIIEYACTVRGTDKSAAQTLLDEVGLHTDAWRKKISTYSKGMRQRTAIAYALAGDPDWLILDEPMSGLDAMGRKHILNVLQRRKEQGCGIMMSSHIVTDLARLCDQVIIMANGKLCEIIPIVAHSMQEASQLEEKLVAWNQKQGLPA